MPNEQRVIASKPKIGSRPAAPAPAAAAPEVAAPKGGKGRTILIAVLIAAVTGGAVAAFFLLGPGKAQQAAGTPTATETTPSVPGQPTGEPGEVLTTDPININLDGGHYLRLGLALQLVSELESEPNAAQAQDLAIALFSGKAITDVSSSEGREALKAELLTQIWEAYEGQVLDVYFTDYVTQ